MLEKKIDTLNILCSIINYIKIKKIFNNNIFKINKNNLLLINKYKIIYY